MAKPALPAKGDASFAAGRGRLSRNRTCLANLRNGEDLTLQRYQLVRYGEQRQFQTRGNPGFVEDIR
jgi:hypothetical protein